MLDVEAIKRRIEQTREDAGEFIQHAPADLDALIVEVERLRNELRALSWLSDRCKEDFLENLSAEMAKPDSWFLGGEGIKRPTGLEIDHA